MLYALMMAARRPLVRDHAPRELAGRIRGLLQEDNRKEQRRRGWVQGFALAAPPPVARPQETRPDLARAVGSLSAEDRRLLLEVAAGSPLSEVAAELHISEEAAKKRFQRLCARLRAVLS